MQQWFSSDPHFDHSNILTFDIDCPICREKDDFSRRSCSACGGTKVRKLRPEFADAGEMNLKLIEWHNELVRPQDHWTCLGDFGMWRDNKWGRERFYSIIDRLNGHKRFIMGNHDDLSPATYASKFEQVMSSKRVGHKLLLSHIPLHPDSIPKGWVNVHGHVHLNGSPKGPYINISAEATNYRPVNLDWLMKRADDILKAL